MPESFVSIVNYNQKELLAKCLDSLRQQTYKNFQTIVVDNHSSDGSISLIETHYKEVHLIKLDDNTGFAAANNKGIKKVVTDYDSSYIVLLNNDTVCDPGFLEQMVKTADTKNNIGMVACKMLFTDKPQYINNAGGMIRPTGCFDGIGFNELDSKEFSSAKEVLAPSGGAALYFTKMLLDIQHEDQFFDERFFAYHEDIDLAFRAQLRGWKCYYNPRAIVYHHHSASFNNKKLKNYLCIRNNIFCLYKCLPKSLFDRVCWKVISYFFLKMLKHFLLLELSTAKGIRDGVKRLSHFKEKRRFIQSNILISQKEINRIWSLR